MARTQRLLRRGCCRGWPRPSAACGCRTHPPRPGLGQGKHVCGYVPQFVRAAPRPARALEGRMLDLPTRRGAPHSRRFWNMFEHSTPAPRPVLSLARLRVAVPASRGRDHESDMIGSVRGTCFLSVLYSECDRKLLIARVVQYGGGPTTGGRGGRRKMQTLSDVARPFSKRRFDTSVSEAWRRGAAFRRRAPGGTHAALLLGISAISLTRHRGHISRQSNSLVRP
jgi:hypothetical protein